MRESAICGTEGLIYVTCDEIWAYGGLPPRHYALSGLFAPLNWLDQRLFGAPGPAISAHVPLPGEEHPGRPTLVASVGRRLEYVAIHV